MTVPQSEAVNLARARHEDQVCTDFEDAWQTGTPRLEDYLHQDVAADQTNLLRELIQVELHHRRRRAEKPETKEYLERFPQAASWLPALFDTRADLDRAAATGGGPSATGLFQAEGRLASSKPSLHAGAKMADVPGYEVLEELGRGGMGIVYKAREPALNRLVALKMILHGDFAGAEEVQRFRNEAEATARLQHPHIVQIYAISECQGLPYFALEYCAGGNLLQHLAGQPQKPVEAARLLETLARATAAAHQQQIVHRDLKPHNVLLTAEGMVKLSDFGLAKQLGAASQTHSGAVVGTPHYMAPEQAGGQGKKVGPACDIYALGAILYYCLTELPPFHGPTPLDTIVQVMEQEPVSPGQLTPGVPRDLETICLKCLQKDPGKRYATALALAEDLRRFQHGEPILARPVGRWERLAKWARRRPGVAALSGALLLATVLLIAGLSIGIVLTSNALDQARHAEQAKEIQRLAAEQASIQAQEATKAEVLAKEVAQKRLKHFERANEILASVFRDVNPRYDEEASLPLKAQLSQRLENAAKLLEGEEIGDPLVAARLQATLADAFCALGFPDRAIALFSKARQVLEAQLGPDSGETLSCLNNLAVAYNADGQWASAIALNEMVLQRRTALLGADDLATLKSTVNLALEWVEIGQKSKALQMLEQSLPTATARHGADHRITLEVMNSLGCACLENGQPAKARALLEETLQRRERVLGGDHPQTLLTMSCLAMAYRADKQFARAIALQEKALEMLQAKLGADHPDTLLTRHDLGNTYRAAGQSAKAVALLSEVLARRQLLLRPDHPQTIKAMGNLAFAYKADGQLKKALPLYEEVVKKRTLQLGADHPATLTSMNNLAVAYRTDRQLSKAIALHEQTLEARKVQLGADDKDTLQSMVNLAVAYESGAQPSKALALLEPALAKRESLLGPTHPNTLETMDVLAVVCLTLHRYAQAESLLERWIGVKRSSLPTDDLTLARRLAYLGSSRTMQHKHVEAEEPLRESVAIYQKKKVRSVASAEAESLLGAALTGQKKYAEAEPLLVGSAKSFKADAAKLSAAQRPMLLAAVQRVIDLYEAMDQPEDAAQWLNELESLKKNHPNRRI